MIFSVLLIGFAIASFIVSSDLLQETNYTLCNVNNTLSDLFSGTPAGASPSWSGVDNFNTFASEITSNFPNSIPTLAGIFTSSSYTAATSNIAGTAYTKAVTTYACPSLLSTSQVPCPYSNVSLCAGGISAQTPIFSEQFCNSTNPQSAAGMVLTEQ
jgi:hypothetical protein